MKSVNVNLFAILQAVFLSACVLESLLERPVKNQVLPYAQWGLICPLKGTTWEFNSPICGDFSLLNWVLNTHYIPLLSNHKLYF